MILSVFGPWEEEEDRGSAERLGAGPLQRGVPTLTLGLHRHRDGTLRDDTAVFL